MSGLWYDTELVVDFSGDEPEHQARLTLSADDVAEFRRAVYDAAIYARHHVHNLLDASLYDAMLEYLQRVEKQVGQRSLAGYQEWMATGGA